MDEILKVLSVIALAAMELWAAIPAGFALGLNPFLIGSGAAVGAIMGTLFVVVAGERLRNWIIRRHSGGKEKQSPGIVQRIWQRYGVIGLGFLAPLLTGAPIGAALGLAFGAPPGRLIVWMSVGIILWTAILTIAGVLGLAEIEKLF